MVITPEKDNTKVNVEFKDEDGKPQAVEITKNPAGQWTPSADLPKGVVLNRDTGVITLTPDSVHNDEPVSATGTSGNNPESDANTLAQPGEDAPSKEPTIEHGTRPGSVDITPEKDNTKLTVKFTDEANMPKEVIVEKDPVTGKWEPVGTLPKEVSVNPDTGKVTLGPDAVLEGQPVTAIGQTGNNPEAATDGSFVAGTDPVSPTPTVTNGAQPGSVDIIPATGNTKVTADFTGEDGLPKQVVAEKDPITGTWSLKAPTPTEGVRIDPTTGRITLDPNAVADGSPVTAQGQNGDDPISPVTPADQAFTAPTDARSEKPAISAGRQPGSMLVAPHPENDRLTVTFKDEAAPNLSLIHI